MHKRRSSTAQSATESSSSSSSSEDEPPRKPPRQTRFPYVSPPVYPAKIAQIIRDAKKKQRSGASC